MFTLIENGDVYGPEPMGRTSILLVDETIQKIGNVDRRAVEQLGVPLEVIDASGCYVTPGLIDPHQHLLGGSGEEGFSSQTPEIGIEQIVTAGITTVVGCLGVDTTMKTMPGLLARAKALKEEGLTAFIWSGGYNVPPTTITDDIRDDIMFIDEVIGAGEIAISDQRSTDPTALELARVVSDAYIGGMLSRKAGVTHFHVGETDTRLKLLKQIIHEFDTPPHVIYPTHVERTEPLMREAIELVREGCFVDLDTAGEDLTKSIRLYFDSDADPGHLTLSSDASKTGPEKLLDQIRTCIRQKSFEVSRLISLVTKNTASVLKLDNKGSLAAGKAADVLVMHTESLELKEVIARGKRLLKNGRFKKER